jgi:FkbM family methyltransferase
MSAVELIYTAIARSRPLRILANAAIRAILPEAVRCGDARVVINPRDPVVSGALAFGVYERSGISFMRRMCKPGQVMVDVGANVGLYTALAGVAVGPAGRVIALEPDPESFRFLEQTIRANQLTNAKLVQAAASSMTGTARLFTCSENRGDNRLYRHHLADGCIEIDTLRLDDYLEAEGVTTVDLLKIDVQGFEGHVITGLERAILRSPCLTMLMEFWPSGLSQAGTSPLELLQRLEGLGLLLYELERGGGTAVVKDKIELISRLPGRRYTNIVAAAGSCSLG